METSYWQFWAWDKHGTTEYLVTDIMEAENPRALASMVESVHGLSKPAAEDEQTKHELRLYSAGAGEELGKWDIVRAATPAKCRKPRACIMRDGAPIDLERFCFDHLQAQ